MNDPVQNTPQNTENPNPKPASELYPEAYKGALRVDPTVEFKKKTSFWPFGRRNSDSFTSLWVLVIGIIIFGLACALIVYKVL